MGKVVEEHTQAPVPEAVVTVLWIGRTVSGSWFVETHEVCYHAETFRTDAGGRYRTPAWKDVQDPNYKLEHRATKVFAYKPGYAMSVVVDQQDPVIALSRFAGDTQERLEYLERIVASTTCPNAGKSARNLYRLLSAIAEEASGIAETPDEKRRARRLAGFADNALVDRSKPTTYNEQGRFVNVNPTDSFRAQDVK